MLTPTENARDPSAIEEIYQAVAILQGGQKREARQRLLELWERLKSHAAPMEHCILAHFLADTEEDVRQELDWDLIALKSATGQPSESNAAALTPELAGFLPSLHLNVGDAYRRLGDLLAAQRHAEFGLSWTQELRADGYGNLIRAGLQRLKQRVSEQE